MQSMDNLTTLQQTVAFYCRELLEELSGFPELNFERDGFRAAVEAAMTGDYRPGHGEELLRRLRGVSGEVLAIYSRNPEFTRFERFYVRIQSIMEMCRNLSDNGNYMEDRE